MRHGSEKYRKLQALPSKEDLDTFAPQPKLFCLNRKLSQAHFYPSFLRGRSNVTKSVKRDVEKLCQMGQTSIQTKKLQDKWLTAGFPLLLIILISKNGRDLSMTRLKTRQNRCSKAFKRKRRTCQSTLNIQFFFISLLQRVLCGTGSLSRETRKSTHNSKVLSGTWTNFGWMTFSHPLFFSSSSTVLVLKYYDDYGDGVR